MSFARALFLVYVSDLVGIMEPVIRLKNAAPKVNDFESFVDL